MDLGGLLASTGVGELAAVATAAIIAEPASEGVNRRLRARRLLAVVRLFRSHVAMERGNDFRPAVDPN